MPVAVTIGDPPGNVAGAPANNGVPWANMNQYDAHYVKWGSRFGVDPAIPKAMTVVESGGVDISGGEPGSTGILQIMPQFWNDTANHIGVDLNTPEGQIAVCCAILSGQSGHGDFGNWEANFRAMYFPSDDPFTGITQNAYVAWIKNGVNLIHDAPQSEGPTSPSGFADEVDVPQPEEFDDWWTVEVTADAVPVLQRARPDAPHVKPDILKGDSFQAPYLVYGQDGEPYWIGRFRGRVPAKGTKCAALNLSF